MFCDNMEEEHREQSGRRGQCVLSCMADCCGSLTAEPGVLAIISRANFSTSLINSPERILLVLRRSHGGLWRVSRYPQQVSRRVLVDFLKPLAENVEMVYMYQKGVKWREMARNPSSNAEYLLARNICPSRLPPGWLFGDERRHVAARESSLHP